MTLPTLTWVNTAEQVIPCAGSFATYAEFLNKLKTIIDASTYWNALLSLDVGNSRGYLELSPKSSTTGVKEGRILVGMSSGTVAGAAGSERPLKAYRLAPWNTSDTSLAPKMWVGMSADANTLSGPLHDPWSNAGQPYTNWTKFIPLTGGLPGISQTMWIVESAEAINVFWTVTAGHIQGFMSGKYLESLDGNSAKWCLFVISTDTDNVDTATVWSAAPGAPTYPPVVSSGLNNSTAMGYRPASVALDTDNTTVLTIGKTHFDSIAPAYDGKGYSNITDAVFQGYILSGGMWFGPPSDQLLGFFRQVRCGPGSLRNSVLLSGGVAQGVYVSYDNQSITYGGLWFDNFR